MNTATPGLRNGVPFRVTVRFSSDWMCATGTVRHGASGDRQIQRDVHQFPMLGGKTLMAVLRDAAETVACGLDLGGAPAWQHWVEALFGSQPAREDPARQPPSRRAPLRWWPGRCTCPMRCGPPCPPAVRRRQP